MVSQQNARSLWIYAAGNAVSRFGGQFQFIAVSTLTYTLTHSPLATALQMAITGLPFILLARWSGIPADRFDPRRVITVVSLVQAFLTLGYLLSDHLAWIVLLNFLVASASAFLIPARRALVPQMVGKEHLLKANARLASIGGVVELTSPIVAGYLVARTGPSTAFLFNAASFLFPALAMFLVQLAEPVRSSVAASVSAFASTFAFLRESKGMTALLAGYGGYMLGMWSVNAIFFPYTFDVLQGDSNVVGWSISAYFGAYSLTGFVLERWGERMRHPRWLFGAFLAGAVVWVGYAFTRSIPIAILLSAFDGIVYTYAITLFETRVQEEAPPESRGRIFGVIRAYDELSTVTGQLMGGALATYTGVLPGIRLSAGLTGGIVAIVLAVSGYRARRQAAESLSD